MKSFLLKDGTPICKWGSLPDNIFYEGKIPDGCDLAIAPAPGYIIIDVDNKKNKNGFKHIPKELLDELNSTFNYPTKNNGKHHWFKYTGNKILLNTSSNIGIDLRVSKRNIRKGVCNNGGYVKWHPRDTLDIRDCIHLIKDTSKELNKWLEKLFA